MILLIFFFLGVQAIIVNQQKSCQFVFLNQGIDFTNLPKYCSNGQKGNVLLSLKTAGRTLTYCYTFPVTFQQKTEAHIVKVDLFHTKFKSESECSVEIYPKIYFKIRQSQLNQRFQLIIMGPGILFQYDAGVGKDICGKGKLYSNLGRFNGEKCYCDVGYTGTKCDRLT